MSNTARPKSSGDELAADEINQDLPVQVTGGETISGDTTPAPAYIDSADGEFYECDASDADKLDFIGFIVDDTSDGNAATLQKNGVVSGFSGLSAGSRYYVQNSGGIGTSIGTYGILVGIALSSTTLLIIKNDRVSFGAVPSDDLQASADTEQTRSPNSYAKMKQITANVSGEIRVKFDLKDLGGGTNGEKAELRKNGVVLYTDIDATTSYVTKSYDIPVSCGDQIQIYGKGDNANAVYIRNFRLYFVLGALENTVVDID